MNITQDGPHNIHQRIEDNAQAIRDCLPLPLLNYLRSRIAELTPRAIVDTVGAKADLAIALQALDEGIARQAKHDALCATRDQLQAELEAFNEDQRRARADLATKAYQATVDEYNRAGLALCRAYRKVLEQHRRLTSVPGTNPNTALPREFDFQPAMPHGWDGTVAYAMRQGLLPFEQAEKLAQAA